MRNSNVILTSVVMAGMMVLGVRYFRDSTQRWPAQYGETVVARAATEREGVQTPSTKVGNSVVVNTDVGERTTSLSPVPDIISQDLKTLPETQRHVASLHPEMLTPGNFEYLGAFMPPHFEDDRNSFSYSSGVIAYRPDVNRPETETTFAGSLFLTGHSQHQRVAEISIPKPFLSRLKRAEELPRAEQLQPFADATHGIMRRLSNALDGSDFRIGGLQVVGDKLHWTTHIYYNAAQYDAATHGCCSLDLSRKDAQGPWHLGDAASVSPETHSDKHAGYIFTIPDAEATRWFGGKNLISGFWTATGLQNSSHGPSMFAYSLPQALPPGGSIEMLPLVWHPMQKPLDGHKPADRWGGGAWLTLGQKQAVIMIGQKSMGETYYGLARPEDCTVDKGWHGTPYETHVYFYSPASLIHSAHGAINPTDIQTWMRWTDRSEGGGIGQYLFPRCYRDVGGVAYDRDHQLLYVSQPNVGTTPDHPYHALPLIHVFRIVE